ncbi:transposase [Aquamicrobium lusatiense]|nr:transposase [Aquamicrobium lusatiense]MDH4989743.1 transposase [Aquamicrobium lusatiense]
MAWISPYFPLPHGVARVDDRRVIGGIVYVSRNGLQWKDAPAGYRPHKMLYNRFIRWSLTCVFDRVFGAASSQTLRGEGSKPERIMIDATHLKVHRTAARLLKKGCSPSYRANQRRPELETAHRLLWVRTASHHAPVAGAEE